MEQVIELVERLDQLHLVVLCDGRILQRLSREPIGQLADPSQVLGMDQLDHPRGLGVRQHVEHIGHTEDHRHGQVDVGVEEQVQARVRIHEIALSLQPDVEDHCEYHEPQVSQTPPVAHVQVDQLGRTLRRDGDHNDQRSQDHGHRGEPDFRREIHRQADAALGEMKPCFPVGTLQDQLERSVKGQHPEQHREEGNDQTMFTKPRDHRLEPIARSILIS
ncbi:MAG: hypothetical protein ACPGVU_13520 [Limisphaerales bacterium]